MSEDLQALWKVWVPATLVNFAFMPMWGRIPMVAATSLIWSCILSSMRGGDVIHSEEMAGGGLISGANFTLVREGLGELFSSPVDDDHSMSHLCLSAAGPDRVGWVAKVAGKVADSGGNITHSKMVRLGKDFTILMHVSISPEKKKLLVAALKADRELKPLNIQTSDLQPLESKNLDEKVMGVRIHCVGEDRPGMLSAIAKKVSEENLSVENITTEIRMIGGKREFVINCDCTATHALAKEEVDSLFEDFSGLKEDIGFDVIDVRVHLEK